MLLFLSDGVEGEDGARNGASGGAGACERRRASGEHGASLENVGQDQVYWISTSLLAAIQRERTSSAARASAWRCRSADRVVLPTTPSHPSRFDTLASRQQRRRRGEVVILSGPVRRLLG